MIFIDNVILVISVLMVFCNGCVGVIHIGLVAHVRSSVMHLSLGLMVSMFVIYDWLVMDPFVMVLVSVVVSDTSVSFMICLMVLMEVVETVNTLVFTLFVVIVMDGMAMVQLGVVVVIESVLGCMMVFLIMVLVTKVLSVVIFVSHLMELRSVVQIVIIWVHVLDQRFMVVDLVVVTTMLVIGISIEVHWVLIFFLTLNHNIVVRVIIIMLEEVFFFVTRVNAHSHFLCVPWHQVTIKLASVGVKVRVSMSGALSVILGLGHVKCLLQLQSFVKGV